MSEKARRKKDGHDKSKERQAMREGPENISRVAHQEKIDTHDPADIVKYKTGTGSDRNRTGAV